jgi:hypothetical protein
MSQFKFSSIKNEGRIVLVFAKPDDHTPPPFVLRVTPLTATNWGPRA